MGDMAKTDRPHSILKTWFAMVTVGWLFVPLDMMRAQPAARDVDDFLRAVQIRDLFADGQWFDLHLPQIALPGGVTYESHWSRLVDLPYWMVGKSLGLFIGPEAAFQVASFIIPPLLFLLFTWLIASTAHALLRRPLKLLELGVLLAVASQISFEFVPFRIDHHGMQFCCLAAIGRGLTLTDPVKAGLLTGLSTTLSITIGLETAPLLVILVSGLAMTAVWNDLASQRLSAYGGSLALSALISAAVFIGPSAMFSSACDAFSGTYLFAMAAGGALLFALPLFWRASIFPKDHAMALRLGSLILCGGLVAGACVLLFPECLGGPYHMIDPVSRAFWLDNVTREGATHQITGVYGLFGQGLPMTILIPAGIAAIIVAAIAAGSDPEDRDGRRILIAMAVLALTLGVFTIRQTVPAYVMSLSLVPYAIHHIAGQTRLARLASASFALVLAAFLVSGWLAPPSDANRLSAYVLIAGDTCDGADFSPVRDLPEGRVLATFAIGERLLAEDHGLRLSTISFHRSAPGIREMADVYSHNTEDVSGIFEPFDYVMVCRRDLELEGPARPVFQALIRGEDLPGLTRISGDAPGTLMIYSVDK